MKTVIVLTDRLNHWIFNVIAVLFGAVALITLYQVFARYVLHSPLVWSEELVRYIMIWIVLLGTAIALRKGLLISVEVVLHLVPERVRKVMQFVIIGINMVFLVLLIKYGFEIVSTLGDQTYGAMNLPVSWTYGAIPVGAGLALLNCVAVLIELILNSGEETKDGGNPLL